MSDTSASYAGDVQQDRPLPNGADDIGAQGNGASNMGAARLQEAFGSVAGEVQSIVKDRMGQVRQAAASTYDMAKARGESTKAQMDDYVRARPWEAASFAALIGLALGLYIAR